MQNLTDNFLIEASQSINQQRSSQTRSQDTAKLIKGPSDDKGRKHTGGYRPLQEQPFLSSPSPATHAWEQVIAFPFFITRKQQSIKWIGWISRSNYPGRSRRNRGCRDWGICRGWKQAANGFQKLLRAKWLGHKGSCASPRKFFFAAVVPHFACDHDDQHGFSRFRLFQFRDSR